MSPKKAAAEKMRADKLLANSGYGTRSEIKKLLKTGAVTVGGIVVKDGAMKVDPSADEIYVHGERVNYRKFIYIAMNKPAGVVSATEDNVYGTVVDLLGEEVSFFNPFPVGRLDVDTTGLLLLTNDGDFAHRVITPKKHIPKVYEAVLEDVAEEGCVAEFEKGITLKNGYKCLPAKLCVDEKDARKVTVTVYEGKFHQVKKMFEACDNKITALHRKCIGGFVLDEADIPRGSYRCISDEELESIFKE